MSEYNPQPEWKPADISAGNAALPPGTEPTTSADRWALIAMTVTATLVLSMCLPGFSCLAPLVVGVIALLQAKEAANPERARMYGWIATGVGGLMLLAIIVGVVLYGALIVAVINEAQNTMPR